jgi:hypothetical protein
MDKKSTREINRFVDKIKAEFNPEKVILFGSRAEGTDWKRSDYDFIIVSSKFKNMHWLKRISKVVRLWDVIADIDVLPYTPDEFEYKKLNSSVVRNALKQGKSIAL